jgi:hypothetical protein
VIDLATWLLFLAILMEIKSQRSLLLWVSSLAYPICLGLKGFDVDREINRCSHGLTERCMGT